MNEGKIFEKYWRLSVPKDVFFYRFIDGTSSWSQEKCPKCKTAIPKSTRFQLKNICDCFIVSKGKVMFIELKTIGLASFPFSNISDSQITKLQNAVIFTGVKAGIVVNFRKYNETYYMSIELFNLLKSQTVAKSVPISDFRKHAILIKQIQKNVYWYYDIEGFLK